MNNCKIAGLDVHYNDYARACCVVFEMGPVEKIVAEYCEIIDTVNEYIPGEFYKRELPCLLQVYQNVKEKVDIIIIDGFVQLGPGKMGLGGRLFTALDKKIPVIGVAKTYFKGCTDYRCIYRGASRKPLYISSIGVDLEYSAALIKNLGGANRIPAVLKRVDQLTRNK